MKIHRIITEEFKVQNKYKKDNLKNILIYQGNNLSAIKFQSISIFIFLHIHIINISFFFHNWNHTSIVF